MLAMVLAAAIPALAQGNVEDSGAGAQAAAVSQSGTGNVACVQQAVQNEFGKTQIAVSQYGDATNINIQAISQQCNVAVSQVNNVVASVTASATASAPTGAQYQYKAPVAVQYQYSATASAAPELPSTGGSSLIALGAGVLLVAGGLLARRIVR